VTANIAARGDVCPLETKRHFVFVCVVIILFVVLLAKPSAYRRHINSFRL